MPLRNLYLALLLSLSFSAQAQSSDTLFKKEWLGIDTLIVKNDLTKTALNRISKLYQKAKQQQLPDQVIKCLVYQYALQDRITSEDPNPVLKSIQQELTASTDDVQKAILHSLLAKLYLQYFNEHRWNLYDRKNTSKLIKEDITAWGAEDFHAAISGHFFKSLEKTKLLQVKRSEDYDAVILQGNIHTSRRTLFDLLAYEALDYFKSGDNYISKPTYAFTLKDENALNMLDNFIRAEFATTDSSAQQWIVLQLFQQLLSFHRNDKNQNMLLELNLERIEWVYSSGTFLNKEAAYIKALEEITSLFKSSSPAAQAWYLLARAEADNSKKYSPFGDTSNRYGFVKARQMAEKALLMYTDTSRGIANLQNLLTEIKHKELKTQTEIVTIPGKPFRALVNYRNVDTLYGRIIRINHKEEITDTRWDDDYWKNITRLKAYQSFTQVLPNSGDHQLHSVEIKLESLPVGEYALLCSSSPGFDANNDKLSIQVFHVSNISYVKNKSDFFVLDRRTGKPMPDVKVELFQKLYNNTLRRNFFEKIAERTTDENGYFNYTEKPYAFNISYSFSKGKDRLELRETDNLYNQPDELPVTNELQAKTYETDNHRIFYFTDRAIYRPGQTVFFKGIAVTRDHKTKLSKLVTDKNPTWLYLKDVNHKKIDSLQYVLNEFGSFNGKFQLPQNTLTGSFSLDVEGKNQATTYFSVEEYKRPTFSVNFEKAKGAYRLNDSVTIVGYAKAFAGNNIESAKVAYHVTRNTRFIEPWYWRSPHPSGSNREISFGELTTDASGKFSITFKAAADDITDRTGNPLFDFSVTADVTDINGETRSNQTSVTVGYASLLLNVGVPDITESDSLKNISISSTNLSYEKEPATVHVKVFALQSPEQAKRKRYWPRPDQFIMSRDEFAGYFPTDEYDDESNYLTWPVIRLVSEGTIDTKDSNTYTSKPGSLQPGYYRIEAVTKDKYGVEVKTIRYTQLFNRSNTILATPAYQFNYTIKGSAEPGQTATFISGSAADHLYIIRKIASPQNKTSDYQFSERNKGIETINYTPDENDRGGVTIDEVYVHDNRVYTQHYAIDVPWTNKMLQVKYESYRDKTEPGSKEKWTVTVQTDKNEKAAAELLTGMYDASLDQFKTHDWAEPNIRERNLQQNRFIGYYNFRVENSIEKYIPEKYLEEPSIEYDRIASNASDLWNRGLTKWINDSTIYITVSLRKSLKALNEAVIVGYGEQNKVSSKDIALSLQGKAAGLKVATMKPLTEESYNKPFANASVVDTVTVNDSIGEKVSEKETAQVQPRRNFNETAFFFPLLYADTSGKYSFSFTMPEALTQWKWISIAHTKDLAFGSYQTNIITQKKLMVQPNAPRFMREGDNMEFSTKIVNLSDKEITGQVSFELIDAASNTSVDGWFQNVFPSQYFTVDAGQSFAVKFPLQVPFGFNRPLTWRIIAKANEFSDGEENTLPVLTNRILVTETLPVFLQGDTTQQFKFDKLLNNTSESLTHEGLTVEYTSNPVWYAVQALPYLMEYPYECVEQTFNRFYANCLASFIVNKHPKIKQVFEQWKADSSSFKSNLQKNEELKQLLLQETPWVLQAESEAQQQKNISLLFDLVKLSTQTESLIEKLSQLQLPDGSFSWFKGGYGDRYMTNYILTGIGKLKRLGALSPDIVLRIRNILVDALKYADSKAGEDYRWLIKNKVDLAKQPLSSTHIDYLYMRSFFRDIAIQSPEAHAYFYNHGKQSWIKQNSFNRARLGLIYYRNKDEKFATGTILPALQENAISDSKLGMYWKSAYAGHWYQSPIEHQSMMITFMSEINTNEFLTKQINAMKTWLLLNKQTTNWKTTIATADACYALLLNGSDWLNTERKITIQLGNYTINSSNEKATAGTGYFKKRIEGKQVTPDMGNIEISTKYEVRSTNKSISQFPNSPISQSISWGSIYWQYFEDMDKVTVAASPLSISKKLFIERNTEKGKVLELIKEGEELKTGNKVVIRMELRSDRDMEYLHLKDMRAASMEPVNVLSGYKWQDGLGYYESTKDASSNFFISYLPKGTYVFEYPVFITHSGLFSVGLATIQCMYAPEFTSHSEGIKIRVAN